MKFGNKLCESSPMPEQGRDKDGAEVAACVWSHLVSPQSKPMPPQSRLMSPQTRLLSPQSRLMSPQPRLMSPQSRLMSPQSRIMSPQSRVMSYCVSQETHDVSPQSHLTSQQSHLVSAQSDVMPQQSPLVSQQSHLVSPQSLLMSQQSHLMPLQSHIMPQQSNLMSQQSHLMSQQSHLISQQSHFVSQQSHLVPPQTMLPGHCPPGHAPHHHHKPRNMSPERQQWTRSLDKCAGIEKEWGQTPPNNNYCQTIDTGAISAQLPRAVHQQPATPAATPCQQRWQRTHTVQPLHCFSNNRCIGAGRAAVTRVSAYYSARPPAAPLQLVPVMLATPPALPMHSSTSSPPPPTSTLTMHFDDERCKKAVRSVLCELMAALPLSAPCSPAHPRTCTTLPVHPAPPVPTTKHAAHVHSEPVAPNMLVVSPTTKNCRMREGVKCSSENSDSIDVESSVGAGAAGADPVQVCRHVATQAQAAGCIRSNDGCQERTNDSANGADEWFGGVRALRDSHVRLVLRQLRHIERLNRALDRVGRNVTPAPAPAPASAPLASPVRQLSTPSSPIHNVH